MGAGMRKDIGWAVLIKSWVGGSECVLKPWRKRAAASKQVKAWQDNSGQHSRFPPLDSLDGTWLLSLILFKSGADCSFRFALPFTLKPQPKVPSGPALDEGYFRT
jgi:hypothetical protein